MRAHNRIINAYNRERRERQRMPEGMNEFKPTHPLSMEEYCVVPRPLDTRELIIEAVRVEDELNHVARKMEVPKEMTYPSNIELKPASKRAFFKEIVTMLIP